MRKEWKWTPAPKQRLKWAMEAIDELKDYLPLTVRQIFYQLVVKNLIKNTDSHYGMLNTAVRNGRIDGYIPWEAIEDRSRQAYLNRGWVNQEDFLETERSNFLEGYRRDLQQGQENYIEVWLEKAALSGIFQRMLNPYCIPLVPTSGFESVTFLNDYRNRVLTSIQNNQRAVMLYFGDHDPSGKIMLDTMETTLVKEMKAAGIKFDPVALTLAQANQYNVPVDMKAAKKTDTRYKEYKKKYGDVAVELDALSPKQLQEVIKKAVEKYIDLSKFEYHQREQKKEALTLKDFKQKVETFIDDNW